MESTTAQSPFNPPLNALKFPRLIARKLACYMLRIALRHAKILRQVPKLLCSNDRLNGRLKLPASVKELHAVQVRLHIMPLQISRLHLVRHRTGWLGCERRLRRINRRKRLGPGISSNQTTSGLDSSMAIVCSRRTLSASALLALTDDRHLSLLSHLKMAGLVISTAVKSSAYSSEHERQGSAVRLTLRYGCSKACAAVIRLFGSTVSILAIRSLASREISAQYSSWKLYTPFLIFANNRACTARTSQGNKTDK